MSYTLSQRMAHFFHVVSNIRPVVWIGLYVCATPLFALIYWGLPEGSFRIPDGDITDYGSWLYYSIVTITTLGFGDYTPAHPAAQAITAIEVMCGLIFLGLFLNAVGAMKSEIDVESEIEKQKALHHAAEADKLKKSAPLILNALNVFLAYCYAVTTPTSKRSAITSDITGLNRDELSDDLRYNPDFRLKDMADLFEPSGLPFDKTTLPAVERLLHSAERASIALDSLQQRVDLTLWPRLLEDCFSFVANFQMFANTDLMFRNPDHIRLADGTPDSVSVKEKLKEEIENFQPDDDLSLQSDLKAIAQLYEFIKINAQKAQDIEASLSQLALNPQNQS